MELLLDPKVKAEYDEVYDKGEILLQFPLKTMVCHFKYKKINEVEPRDLISLVKIHEVRSPPLSDHLTIVKR